MLLFTFLYQARFLLLLLATAHGVMRRHNKFLFFQSPFKYPLIVLQPPYHFTSNLSPSRKNTAKTAHLEKKCVTLQQKLIVRPMSISKTRQKLIAVARELFAKKGFDGITMNDIAQASQKGRRTMYTYFNSKEDIYYAVIEDELEHLSEEMDKVVNLPINPQEKIVKIIYTHLFLIEDVVKRNGSLRAEFFSDIHKVERVRRKFDLEELHALRSILREGVDKGIFKLDHINLTADVIHYAIKGIEVPFMFERLVQGLSIEESVQVVERLISRALGASIPQQS